MVPNTCLCKHVQIAPNTSTFCTVERFSIPKLDKNLLVNADANQITFIRLCTIFSGFNDRINISTVTHCRGVDNF